MTAVSRGVAVCNGSAFMSEGRNRTTGRKFMHRPWHFAVPLALTVCAAVAAPPSDVRNAPEPQKPVAADPMVNPNAPAAAELPPTASRGRRIAEEDERGENSWESAKWSQSMLNVHGSASQRVAVAGPSSVMIKAEWHSTSDLDINVLHAGAPATRLTPTKTFNGTSSAVATVQVRRPGQLTINVGGGGAEAIPVKLYVGILPTSH
jgi:hypothetical protein